MTVNSPNGSTLQCDTWLGNDMPLNSPKRPPYWNSTSGLDFDHITAVNRPMSFCTSLRSFIQNLRHKKITSCRFSRRLNKYSLLSLAAALRWVINANAENRTVKLPERDAISRPIAYRPATWRPIKLDMAELSFSEFRLQLMHH